MCFSVAVQENLAKRLSCTANMPKKIMMSKFVWCKMKKNNINPRWIVSASTEKILTCCEDVFIQHGKKPTVVWGLLKKSFFLHIMSHGMKITPSLWGRVWFLLILKNHSVQDFCWFKTKIQITETLQSVSAEIFCSDKNSSCDEIGADWWRWFQLTAINHHFWRVRNIIESVVMKSRGITLSLFNREYLSFLYGSIRLCVCMCLCARVCVCVSWMKLAAAPPGYC